MRMAGVPGGEGGKMRKQQGFSLIELLIVIAIILVIAAIAIPNLMHSRMAANESSAAGCIRSLATAQVAYQSTYPSVGFACSLSALGPASSSSVAVSSTAAGLIDGVLASGQKAGYTYALANCTGTPAYTYQSTAAPMQVGSSGQRAFCSDQSGIIKYATDGSAATCTAGTLALN